MEFTGERYLPEVSDPQITIEHLQRYSTIVELVKGKRVLDAACGEGYGSYLLASTADKVVGIDIDENSIIEASQKYKQKNLIYMVSSIDSMPFELDSFDVVISFETIEHVDEHVQHEFLKEIKRVLVPEGLLIISTPNKELYSDKYNYNNQYHVKEFYKNEFKEFLGTYFNEMRLFSQRYEVLSVINDNPKGNCQHSWEACVEASDDHYLEKYMIAVCSSSTIIKSVALASVVPYPSKYDQMLDRILNLQEEVTERNEHIKTLDEEISFLRLKFEEYNALQSTIDIQNKVIDYRIAKHQLELQSKNEEIQRLGNELSDITRQLEVKRSQLIDAENQLVKAQKEASDKDEEISNYKTEINNKKGHIELLLVQERRLHQILDSTGWSFLCKLYRIRDVLLPNNSRRKIVAKLLIKTLKNPKRMLSKFNRENFKKVIYYSKTEELSRLEQRIDTFVDRDMQVGESKDLQLFEGGNYSKLIFDNQVNPMVSIIIPVYNQWNYTYACLASILENTKDISYEVIVADDMSTDETVNLKEYVENVTVVRDGENRGFLLNCNNAAEHANGKYIFFLNNDTNVQPEWLSSLVNLMENDNTIGLSGSKLVYPDGRQQEAGGIIWNDASGWNYGRLDDPHKPDYNYVKESDYISGAAIMIRKSLWDQLGGFDERYVPAYFEDTDLAFEVRRLGYRVVFQPSSVVVHFEGISHGTDTGSGIKSYQLKNKEKFLEKWADTLHEQHFNNAEHVFLARDRSKHKKVIVIVDHYVPHYDKDAGGRCTYFYSKLFVSLGYKVIFIGDNFYQHEPYTAELQQLGIEVLYGNWYAKNIMQWIKNNGQYFDYVYLNRPHISIKYIDVFKKHTKAKIIYFGHDLHYIREMRNYEITGNSALLKSAEEWKQKEFELISKSDVVHVVGNYEQGLLKQEFPSKLVRNIPLFIYPTRYEHASEFENRKHLLFVGGFNHKPNHDGVMWFINQIWPKIKEVHADIKFYIVGSNPPDDIKSLQSDDIIVTGYVTDEQLTNYYNICRVVVVPLRFGAGVKGKVVEAMYHQVPTVTTTIGAEGLEAVETSLRITDNEDMFAAATIDVYSDISKWNELSENSGRYIEEHFTEKAAKAVISMDFD
ncbi:glycosyltransferase [Paenibacillaceae sp. P-4]|uniref:glycosyltransferase n=1 Tax=Paenibacillaceae bacterium P-4 TaxID=3160969 RepID=UPI0032E80594